MSKKGHNQGGTTLVFVFLLIDIKYLTPHLLTISNR